VGYCAKGGRWTRKDRRSIGRISERPSVRGRARKDLISMDSISQLPNPINTFECTDTGNADRFTARCGGRFKFCTDDKCWYGWSGKRWKKIPSEQMLNVATSVARGIEQEISSEPKRAGELQDWAQRSQFKERLTAIIELAKGRLLVGAVQFDRDPLLLNCNNGTIDLRNGVLGSHNPDNLITALIPIDYDPATACPGFMKFLGEVFAPHPELSSFIQRAVGYSLTGSVCEECLFLLDGKRRNGKGTLTGTLSHLLGDYGCTIDFASLVAKRNYTGPKDDIANMKGKRFVTAHENREGERLAEDLIKWLTGGDKVRARMLYSNSVEFDPTWKLWLSVNHRPIVSPTDPAIWTRLMIIPFEVSFEGRENRKLKEQLLTELPGILAWAVEGYGMYQREGLNPPECVQLSKEDYKKGMNPLSEFVEDECILEESLTVQSGEVYGRYLEYCNANGIRYHVGHNKFSALLQVMGVQRSRAGTRRAERIFRGIGLKEPVSDTSDTSESKSLPGKGNRKKLSCSNVSERQRTPKPCSFRQIEVCATCGSDRFWCQKRGGELLCCRCIPYRHWDHVAEFVWCVEELTWEELETCGGE
jgi:putative DNA primase/helicase